MINVKGIPCPKCGKKTLSNPKNPKWNAWKDYTKAYCRSCGAKFREKTVEVKDNELDSPNMNVKRILDSPSLIKLKGCGKKIIDCDDDTKHYCKDCSALHSNQNKEVKQNE